MIIRTKEVIMITIDGNNVSTVIKTRISKLRLYSEPPAASWTTLIKGTPVWAEIGMGEKTASNKKALCDILEALIQSPDAAPLRV